LVESRSVTFPISVDYANTQVIEELSLPKNAVNKN
jgi:hypothetical protein